MHKCGSQVNDVAHGPLVILAYYYKVKVAK